MPKNIPKPPLGLIPRFIIDEERKQEILDAVQRRLDENHQVPIDWMIELNEINLRLKK